MFPTVSHFVVFFAPSYTEAANRASSGVAASVLQKILRKSQIALKKKNELHFQITKGAFNSSPLFFLFLFLLIFFILFIYLFTYLFVCFLFSFGIKEPSQLSRDKPSVAHLN